MTLLVALCAVSATVACGSRGGAPIGPQRASEGVFAGPPEEGRKAYLRRLDAAGLEGSALLREWRGAGERALAAPLEVELPYREVGYLDGARPSAVALLLELRAGQRLVAHAVPGSGGGDLFLDLLRWDGAAWRPAGAGTGRLEGVVEAGGRHLLRLQPELLFGGRYTLEVTAGGLLAFPLAGGRVQIIGRWGDPRDDGRRRHEGVDLAAPRGTAAVAAADALVLRVAESRLGGRTVRLVTEDGLLLYYAHLDRLLVREGQRVRAGQPVGEVGDTGNARGTQPHLHFEVRGAEGTMDPLPHVLPAALPAPPSADLDRLGAWARVTTEGTRLRGGPGTSHPVLAELARAAAVLPLAAAGEWHRVMLADGRQGFVAGWLTEPPRTSYASLALVEPVELRAGPAVSAPPMARLAAGSMVEVLARAGEELLVSSGGGVGWLSQP